MPFNHSELLVHEIWPATTDTQAERKSSAVKATAESGWGWGGLSEGTGPGDSRREPRHIAQF